MTKGDDLPPYRPTPAELEDYRAEIAAIVAEEEAETAWLENHYHRHLDLLAWIIRQTVQPQDLQHEENWPDDCDALSTPTLLWLARRDPVIRALATAQLAEDLRFAADERFLLGANKLLLAAEFLTTGLPARRGKHGDNLARNVVLHSLLAFFREAEWNPWGVRGKAPHPLDGEWLDFEPPSKSALAAKLSEDLEAHPLLADLLDVAPSEETIRSVWKSWPVPDDCDNRGRVFAAVHWGCSGDEG